MADLLPSKILRRITKEVNALRTDPPEGIRIVINEDDITDLRAWIQGPAETPYEAGFFKILIKFGAEYPSMPPHCTFATKVFHPNVGPHGEICVNTLKKDWTSTQTLSDILTVVKCLLIYPNPESALDEEAGRLLLEKYDEYRQRAKLWTDIHARIRPLEFPSSECESIKLLAASPVKDLKAPTQPFAMSHQANNPIQTSPTSECENLIKPSNARVADDENQNHPRVVTKTVVTKEKDRRGRKRL